MQWYLITSDWYSSERDGEVSSAILLWALQVIHKDSGKAPHRGEKVLTNCGEVFLAPGVDAECRHLLLALGDSLLDGMLDHDFWCFIASLVVRREQLIRTQEIPDVVNNGTVFAPQCQLDLDCSFQTAVQSGKGYTCLIELSLRSNILICFLSDISR